AVHRHGDLCPRRPHGAYPGPRANRAHWAAPQAGGALYADPGTRPDRGSRVRGPRRAAVLPHHRCGPGQASFAVRPSSPGEQCHPVADVDRLPVDWRLCICLGITAFPPGLGQSDRASSAGCSTVTTPIVALRDVRKNFGATEIIRGVSLNVATGERHALIGPNGAGKTTLFNLVSGRFPITSGEIHLGATRIDRLPPHRINRLGLSRSFQITSIFHRLSVFENLRCSLLWSRGYRYSFWQPLGMQRALNEEAERLLEDLNLAARRDLPAGLLSYAEQRALEIGMTIAGGASVVLLDEPTAGMSHSETEHAVALIRRVTHGRTLLMVEHDMRVVFDLADTVTVLVYGQVIASGPPAAIRPNREVQEAYLGALAA